MLNICSLNRGCASLLSCGLAAWFAVIALGVVGLMHDIEGVILPEASHVDEVLFGKLSILHVHLPRTPLLHDTEELELVVSLVNQLLNKTAGNLLLDSTNAHVLIDDLHPESSKLAAVELVAVLVGQVSDLLQDQVVQLHQLHAGEGLNVHPCDASGELKRALMLHVSLVIECAFPNRKSDLLVPLLLAHRHGVVQVRVLEVGAEATEGQRSKHLHACLSHGKASTTSAKHHATSEHIFFLL